MSSRRITVEELADEISISHGSCHAILCSHLKMKRVAAKVVPKLLTFEQKSNRQSNGSSPANLDPRKRGNACLM